MWQCVEYGKRFLTLTRNMTYYCMDYAATIWNLESFINLKTGGPVPIKKYPNNGPVPP